MASFRGYPACTCLAKWLPVYEAELLRRGLIKQSIDVYQLTGSAAASAGTHAKGGAFDIAQFTAEQLRVARNMGAATWHRRRSQGFEIDHSHGVLKGCPHAAPLARSQVVSLDNRRNGLANNGADDGPRDRVQWPLRTWTEGIAWAKKQPRTHRIGTWNVDLKTTLPATQLRDRLTRIRKRVKWAKLDVLAVQEAPASGQGKHLAGTLIGRDGKPMTRHGSHGRYVFVVSSARDVRWTSIEVDGKRATVVAATIGGRRRAYINAHPVSGSTPAAIRARRRYADVVWTRALKWAASEDVPKADVIWLGDNNGPEAATEGTSRGFLRARRVARIKTRLTRTYNAMGRRKPTDPGGQTDYILIHGTKRTTVDRYRNVWTPRESDHNLVITQLKE